MISACSSLIWFTVRGLHDIAGYVNGKQGAGKPTDEGDIRWAAPTHSSTVFALRKNYEMTRKHIQDLSSFWKIEQHNQQMVPISCVLLKGREDLRRASTMACSVLSYSLVRRYKHGLTRYGWSAYCTESPTWSGGRYVKPLSEEDDLFLSCPLSSSFSLLPHSSSFSFPSNYTCAI